MIAVGKINWKVRFRNKVWLGSFLSLIVGFAYSLLALFDVFPAVTQSLVAQLLNQVLTFLGLIGVIVDPTTAGLGDSERTMGYQASRDDEDKCEAAERALRKFKARMDAKYGKP